MPPTSQFGGATAAGHFGGVFAAAVTPHRLEGHEADIGATLELVDFLAASGVQGTVMLGSTGEFLHVKPSDRARIVQFAVKRSRVPIIAGVSHSTLDGAIEMASEAITTGVAALLLMPPHFFRYDQADIAEFYRRFSVEIGRTNVPILLYNIPQFTSGIAFETVRDLLDSGRYAGIKDSSGDWDFFQQLAGLRAQREFTLFVGNDGIYPEARRAGADGVVSGCACAIPELLVKLDAAITSGDAVRAGMLSGLLNEFIAWTNRFPTPVAIKVATAVRGLKVGPLAVPLGPEKCQALEEFQSWFKGWFPPILKL